MKKLMMLTLCGLMMVPAFAGDVYDLKMSCKTPVIKKATSYYKDFTTTTYKGFVNIEYNTDGTIVTPCDAILYGTFADGKETLEVLMDVGVLNVYGKSQNKAEMNAICDLNTVVFTLAGTGNCKVNTTGDSDSCGDPIECVSTIKISSISGDFTGLITDVLCDPCDDNPWTWVFNSCSSELIDQGTVDIIYGSWSMKYNKSLSAKCDDVGFPECVMDKIPKSYLPAE